MCFCCACAVRATPYACCVTNFGNSVTFTLNEAADRVQIVFDQGPTISLGARPAGTHTFGQGGAAGFEIIVQKSAAPGWRHGVTNQLSSDTDALVQFVHTRGVCVNRNPKSPNFGRIYVSVALPGSTSDRDMEEGIYVLDPRLTDVPGLGADAKTGGLDFADPDDNALSPFRLSVGPDDTLYICDLSTSSGTLYATDPDVAFGQNVFGLKIGGEFPIGTNRIRGSISAAHAEGAPGNDLTLWVLDEDLQSDRQSGTSVQRNSIWRWDLQSERFPASNMPPARLTASPLNGLAPQWADLARGPDGKFYVSQRRGATFGLPGATTAGLFVLTPDGSSNLWNSLSASRAVLQNSSATDILTDTGAIDVSYDGKYIAVLRTNNCSIHVLPLMNGLPDLTNRIQLVMSPTNGPAEDIAFDAANNIYYVSSGQKLLRVLSVGGYSKATTRSDGGFELVVGDLAITGISASAEAIEIDFVFTAPAVPSDFRVECTSTLTEATWMQENANIEVNGSGFRAAVPLNGDVRFYRVRR